MTLAEGSYFGDEEGYLESSKSFYARVSSVKVMLFYLSKEKIKMNAQEIASYLIDELAQKSKDKAIKVTEIIEKMAHVRKEHEKEIAAFEFKKVQEMEREKTQSLHNREIEACNTSLAFSKRGKSAADDQQVMTLHSKLANRVEELVKFKMDLTKRNMYKQFGEGYNPILEAEKFIDFSFAQGGKNLPGRLTMAKQVERANRHSHIAHKIDEFKSQGLKYALKTELPDASKVTYDTLNNKVLRGLQSEIKQRDKPKIFLTQNYRGWRHRIPPKLDGSWDSTDKKSMTARSYQDPQSRIEKVSSPNRSMDHALSDIVKDTVSLKRGESSRLSRVDRASRAISKRLRQLRTLTDLSPKAIDLTEPTTVASTGEGRLFSSMDSRGIPSHPSTARPAIRSGRNQYLTAESWIPKIKLTT